MKGGLLPRTPGRLHGDFPTVCSEQTSEVLKAQEGGWVILPLCPGSQLQPGWAGVQIWGRRELPGAHEPGEHEPRLSAAPRN